MNQSSARTRYTTALFPGVPWKCLMLKTATVQTIGDGPAASVDRRRARLRRRPGLPMCGQIRDRGTCRSGLPTWVRLRLAWWLSVSGLQEWLRARCHGGRTPGASARRPGGRRDQTSTITGSAQLGLKLHVSPDHLAQGTGIEGLLQQLDKSLGQQFLTPATIGGKRNGGNLNAFDSARPPLLGGSRDAM